MKEDSDIVIKTLLHVRNHYAGLLDGWQLGSDIPRLTLARLNAEIARRIPQQGRLSPKVWRDQVDKFGEYIE